MRDLLRSDGVGEKIGGLDGSDPVKPHEFMTARPLMVSASSHRKRCRGGPGSWVLVLSELSRRDRRCHVSMFANTTLRASAEE